MLPRFAMMLMLPMASAIAADDLREVERELSARWRDGAPARNLRVKCRFDLDVRVPDKALGDVYFPNMTSTNGKVGSSTQALPVLRWEEDIARRGEKYRREAIVFPPGKLDQPPPLVVSKRFNGSRSYIHEVDLKQATEYEGSRVSTKLTHDYYSDMIGIPGNVLARSRTTGGDLAEPYQIDRLISTGAYAIGGEERIGDIRCVILERPGLDRIWLAPDKGWAIARREWRWTVGGPLKRRIVNQDFRAVADGIWFPYDASMDVFGDPSTRPNQQVARLHAAVDTIEVDVSDAWFEPDFPRGTLVLDAATGGSHFYGMETETLNNAILKAALLPNYPPPPWWQSTKLRWYLVSGVIVGLVVVVWQRRRR